MSSLKLEDDTLVLKLSGPDFETDLKKAREITGRRYNPEHKTWEYPNDPDTLMEIAFTVEPELTSELRDRVKSARAEVTEELLTRLPDDAELSISWADTLVGKQRAGVDFLAEHPHSILADEMGAGKTVQALSTVYEYILRDGEIVPPVALVVCPNSVTGHWQRELNKWAKAESAIITGGADERATEVTDALREGKWIIVNWEKLALMPELKKVKWNAIIADEAHRAKNRQAKRTKALWKLKAPVQIAATGTPIMNDPGELWSLLKWLRPEQYTSYWAFLANYAKTYSGFRGKQIVVGVKNADSLRFELSDKMVRRTKREIHADIPTPFPPEINEIEMRPKQAAVYQEALKEFWLEVVQEIPQIAQIEQADEAEVRRKFADTLEREQGLDTVKYMIDNAAARTTRLRQIATSPALLGGPDESGKLDAVIEKIAIDSEEGRPFVAFCWYKATVDLVIARLEKHGIDARGFTGDTPPVERAKLAEAFQNEEFQVIVPTISTGGVGIDLYRSSDPMLVEEDWVPAINQQAIDRCDRKGQTASVQPHIFRSLDTVETGKLAPKLKLKTEIVQSILGGG